MAGESSAIISPQISSDFKVLLKRRQGREEKELWVLGVELQLYYFQVE